MQPELFISPRGAETAGAQAVKRGKAKSFVIKPRIRRNPDDRSIERGYVVILQR